jgi:hypothetical protein
MTAATDRPGKPTFSRPFKVEETREKAVDVEIAADPAECEALAAEIGLPAIQALTARFHIVPARQGRLDVTGTVTARLTQVCVVSLDAFDSELEEEIGVVFAPEAVAAGAAARYAARPDEETGGDGHLSAEPPDPIVDGRIDLGLLATEFLVLGLDPYPRKPGVEFEAGDSRASESQDASPFAALARLKGKDPG